MRVLMGDFGAIVRLGLREVFDGEGLDLVAEEAVTGDILERLVEALPDVVMLDLDTEGVEALAVRIARQFPAVKVIACSSVRPTMRVFPPFHNGESYSATLNPAVLIGVVKS
jgi:DNA-binding NarL/FixJ family response regulator